MDKKWAYKPGETKKPVQLYDSPISDMDIIKHKKFIELTTHYNATQDGASRTTVLNDNKDVVFFLEMGEEITDIKAIHVYIFDNGSYSKVEGVTGEEVSRSYFEYLNTVEDAYDLLRRGE